MHAEINLVGAIEFMNAEYNDYSFIIYIYIYTHTFPLKVRIP